MAPVVDTLRLSAEEAMGLLERKEISPAELRGAYFEAISERDGELHCYLRTTEEVEETGPIRVLPGQGPGIIKKVEPEYPRVAEAARLEGTVTVDAVIRKDGSVSDVTVLRSTNKLFNANAVDAIRQWRFTPGSRDVVLSVTIKFVLDRDR